MEALASSAFTSTLNEPYPSRHSSVSSRPKLPCFEQCFFKTRQNSKFLSLCSRRSGLRAASNEVFDGGEGEELDFGHGSAWHELEEIAAAHKLATMIQWKQKSWIYTYKLY